MSQRRRPNEARQNRHSADFPDPPRIGEDAFFERLDSAAADAMVLILDEVTDPHNLGACLRSANAAGAIAILTPKHHSAKITDTVWRVSCGAAEVTPVIAVTNLARAMRKLQDAGFWLVGTDDAGEQSLYELDLTGRIGIVMGAEGKGMRRLTAENCDHLVQIPMSGSVECLNVSVATGVCLFEAVRQRTAKD